MSIPQQIQDVLKKATCLYNKHDIEASLDKMAIELHNLVGEKNPIFLCVVIGGIIPLGNLLTRLDFPLEVDYAHVTRYGDKLKGGELNWLARPTTSLAGRTVVVFDDILDTGITMGAVIEDCKKQGASDVFSAVLVDKHQARVPEGLQEADITGLAVDNHYVFGYGLDYKKHLRNAPGIYQVAPEHE